MKMQLKLITMFPCHRSIQSIAFNNVVLLPMILYYVLVCVSGNVWNDQRNLIYQQYKYQIESNDGDFAPTAEQDYFSIELQDQLIRIMAPRLGTNLTAITWAHAVNNQDLLNEALRDDIDMIEADIVLGKLLNDSTNGNDLPIMAHPPANTSDLTLASFLQQIKVYNEEHVERTKGVKLDFKTIEVFEGSLEILDETIPKMNYPIWLNADIISGPVNETTTIPVDPARFFAGCMRYKQAVLSIGWTTRWDNDTPKDAGYTLEQLAEMFESLKSNNIVATGQAITFPVRAGIAANSVSELHDLVRQVNTTNECTITIWSSSNDYVDAKKLRELILSFGIERVYLDVPNDLAEQLDLGRSGCTARMTSLTNFAMISLSLWALSMWLKKPIQL